MERFAEIVKTFQPLTIFAKRSFLDVWQGSEYTSDLNHFATFTETV